MQLPATTVPQVGDRLLDAIASSSLPAPPGLEGPGAMALSQPLMWGLVPEMQSAPPGVHNAQLCLSTLQQTQARVNAACQLVAMEYSRYNFGACFQIYSQLANELLRSRDALPQPVLTVLQQARKKLTNRLDQDLQVLQAAFQHILRLSDNRSRCSERRSDVSVLELCFDRAGSRSIQSRLKEGDGAVVRDLEQQLPGHGVKFVTSPAAHRVAEAILESKFSGLTVLLLQELARIPVDVAQDKFGCRVLVKAIQKGHEYEERRTIVEKLLKHVSLLADHDIGSHVLQAILEHGDDAWRHGVFLDLQGRFRVLAKQKCLSHIVEHVLTFCEADRPTVALELLGDISWAKMASGRFVAKKLREFLPGLPDLTSKAKAGVLSIDAKFEDLAADASAEVAVVPCLF